MNKYRAFHYKDETKDKFYILGIHKEDGGYYSDGDYTVYSWWGKTSMKSMPEGYPLNHFYIEDDAEDFMYKKANKQILKGYRELEKGTEEYARALARLNVKVKVTKGTEEDIILKKIEERKNVAEVEIVRPLLL